MRWKRKGLGGERGCVNDQGWFVVAAVISISEGGGSIDKGLKRKEQWRRVG